MPDGTAYWHGFERTGCIDTRGKRTDFGTEVARPAARDHAGKCAGCLPGKGPGGRDRPGRYASLVHDGGTYCPCIAHQEIRLAVSHTWPTLTRKSYGL
ncbi:hypothetical protein [Nonomuraea sp. KM90]|uniref:hypothetical protein n=1 Tax=Nonomuraea sp. KM90 TaxID=3457428 RepID=UPI003FCCA7CE